MNIKVQNQRPGSREGSKGEMRLVVTSRGSFLYIKDGNQWHSLRLSPTTTTSTEDRRKRGTFQNNTKTIAGDTADDHDGTILPGQGGAAAGGAGVPGVAILKGGDPRTVDVEAAHLGFEQSIDQVEAAAAAIGAEIRDAVTSIQGPQAARPSNLIQHGLDRGPRGGAAQGADRRLPL